MANAANVVGRRHAVWPSNPLDFGVFFSRRGVI
jgi:hypothetical protein